MANGSTALNKSSKRESLAPVSNDNRVFGLSSYLAFWVSSTVVMQLFIIGQGFVPPNGELNMLQAAIAGFASTIIVALMFVVNSHPGMKHGIPFIVQARSAFGYHGARIASLIRVLPAVFWFGIGSWIGAEAVSYITQTIWGWSSTWIFFIIFQVIQTLLAYFGIETAKWFNSSLSVVVLGFLIYIIIQLLNVGSVEIQNSWEGSGTWGLPFFASITAAVGILITGAVNNADVSRYLKNDNKNNWIGHFIGIVPTYLLLLFTGILSAAVTGIWDPIQALVSVIPNPVIAVLLLIFITVAQITTNLTLNIIPPAIVLMETFNIRWGISTIIVGILGVITFPWFLLTNDAFNSFINSYAAFLGPLLGVLISDYYFVRKGKLNIPGLYKGTVKYNWLGFFSIIVGGIVGIIFLPISWMVGLPIGAILYWIGYKVIPFYKDELVHVPEETTNNLDIG